MAVIFDRSEKKLCRRRPAARKWGGERHKAMRSGIVKKKIIIKGKKIYIQTTKEKKEDRAWASMRIMDQDGPWRRPKWGHCMPLHRTRCGGWNETNDLGHGLWFDRNRVQGRGQTTVRYAEQKQSRLYLGRLSPWAAQELGDGMSWILQRRGNRRDGRGRVETICNPTPIRNVKNDHIQDLGEGLRCGISPVEDDAIGRGKTIEWSDPLSDYHTIAGIRAKRATSFQYLAAFFFSLCLLRGRVYKGQGYRQP